MLVEGPDAVLASSAQAVRASLIDPGRCCAVSRTGLLDCSWQVLRCLGPVEAEAAAAVTLPAALTPPSPAASNGGAAGTGGGAAGGPASAAMAAGGGGGAAGGGGALAALGLDAIAQPQPRTAGGPSFAPPSACAPTVHAPIKVLRRRPDSAWTPSPCPHLTRCPSLPPPASALLRPPPPFPQPPGARCLLSLHGGALLWGGSDAAVRYWDASRPEGSYAVCGPLWPGDSLSDGTPGGGLSVPEFR